LVKPFILPEQIAGRSFKTDPEMAAHYAELTADANRIHLDPDFAVGTSFGAPIVHGTMGLNLLLTSLEEAFGPALNGFDVDVRFVRPVLVGATIRAGAKLLDPSAGTYEVYVETDNGVRVVEGTLLVGRGSAAQAPPEHADVR
jgi:3-hydroxybutyryl-CoA dehydratase